MNTRNKSAIEIAKEIVIDRLQEKERQYGDFNEGIIKIVKIYNLLYSDSCINELMVLRVLVLLKITREGNSHKEDNIIDMIAYLDRLNYFENNTQRPEGNIFDKIRKWAKDKGIIQKGDMKTQTIKCMEEVGELSRAVLHQNKDEIMDAIGDIIVVLTSLAEMNGVKIEQCIQSAYDVIKNRKGTIINNNFVKEK